MLVCPVAAWQPVAGLALTLLVPTVAGLLLKRAGNAAQSPPTITLGNANLIAALVVIAMPLLLDGWFMSLLFDPGPVPSFAAAILPGMVAAATLPFAFRVWKHPLDERDPYICRQCGYLLYGLKDPRCPECGTPFDTWQEMEKN